MDRLISLIVLLSFFHGAFSNLEMLYSPQSLVLKNTNQPLLNSDYAKFVSLCLGYSTEKPSNWNGFYGYKNFANIPSSVVTFHVPISLKGISTQVYPLDDNANIENQHEAISSLMQSKNEDSFSEKVDLFKNKDDSLEAQLDSLNSYMSQLQELKSKNALPQRLSLWFDFVSAPKIEDKLVNKFQLQVQETVRKFRQLFDDKVVIFSIDNQDLQIHTRRARETTDPTKEDYNLAYAYSADYHTAFATIGFTTIVLLLTVFGVSVAMWNIDPGRDSIIYRLTSQKIKKDQ